MTAAGWVMMVSSWGGILALNVYCFYRLLTEKPSESITRGERP